MPSRNTARIAEQRSAIAEIERRLWSNGLEEDLIEPYQAAWRALEAIHAKAAEDKRHRFVVLIPVADRPRHLAACLGSLLEQCRLFGYGGCRDGRFQKIEAFVADDSREIANVARHREIAQVFNTLGLTTHYFGLEAQQAALDRLDPETLAALAPMLGDTRGSVAGHKGASVMRNLAFLELAERYAGVDNVLFHAIDSDQEFKVKVVTATGDRELHAVSFYHALDEIFTRTDALVLTGKVVGDPPVSPAVMAGNFLDDVIAFLRLSAGRDGQAPCGHHVDGMRREGEAAYHDMADLFGFRPAEDAYRFRCPLAGAHDESAGFNHFATRLKAFFYGEHPTRVSYYQYEEALASVRPARTVYTGNYVFRSAGLTWFVPFAPLRLRMAGPSLGRILRTELDGRFVQANLPMLHRRTVEDTAESEFRPGVSEEDAVVDLCEEFERQFYGDVMLFSLERFAADGYPARLPDYAAETIEQVYAAMREKYEARHAAIVARLDTLKGLLAAPEAWWTRPGNRPAGLDAFGRFVASIEFNFGAGSACHGRIAKGWPERREALLRAVLDYPGDRRTWEAAVTACGKGLRRNQDEHGNMPR